MGSATFCPWGAALRKHGNEDRGSGGDAFIVPGILPSHVRQVRWSENKEEVPTELTALDISQYIHRRTAIRNAKTGSQVTIWFDRKQTECGGSFIQSASKTSYEKGLYIDFSDMYGDGKCENAETQTLKQALGRDVEYTFVVNEKYPHNYGVWLFKDGKVQKAVKKIPQDWHKSHQPSKGRTADYFVWDENDTKPPKPHLASWDKASWGKDGN
jgi:hypothetical protein